MKRIVCSVVLLALFSLSAFAANGTARMNLLSPGQVAGKELAPGSYKIEWTGEGNDVQVTITGKKTVVTAPAKVVEVSKAPSDNAVVKTLDGTINEMRFRGKNYSLVFAR